MRRSAAPCQLPSEAAGRSDDLPEQYGYRLSFCCDRDGCRKRVTPPSVRFLGRKVYLGAVVILVAAMRQGPSPRRVRELSKLFGADRRTIARWQVFWREHFPQTPFWKVARGRLVPAVEIVALPRSLLEAFLRGDDPCRAGGSCFVFSRRSRSRGAWRSRFRDDFDRPAEDARRRSRLTGHRWSHTVAFTLFCEETVMTQTSHPSTAALWARFRFSVVGSLLSSPPARGELKAAIRALADKTWTHPVSGREVRFAAVTIERWYYTARREQGRSGRRLATRRAQGLRQGVAGAGAGRASAGTSTTTTRTGATSCTTTTWPRW